MSYQFDENVLLPLANCEVNKSGFDGLLAMNRKHKNIRKATESANVLP